MENNMDTIISKSNEKVKYIKSLNEKKFRQKYNAFYIEGIKVVEEILEIKKAIDIMFIAYSKEILQTLNGGKELLKKIEKLNQIEVIKLSKDVFEHITDTKTPQGILAVVKINEKTIDSIILSEDVIILDRIQDLRKYRYNN